MEAALALGEEPIELPLTFSAHLRVLDLVKTGLVQGQDRNLASLELLRFPPRIFLIQIM